MTTATPHRPTLALYASPKCCDDHNLRLYKSYFNVAWFVRAYTPLLFSEYRVVTTDETLAAIRQVKTAADEALMRIWRLDHRFVDHWRVPPELPNLEESIETLGSGFDAQVRLAARVARREIDRLLIFQDPDDVQTHLPEAHALIRNCTLADVPLYINAGATFWAEAEIARRDFKLPDDHKYGDWRRDGVASFHALLNPSKQRVAFISHDTEKQRMSRFIYHFSALFRSDRFELMGTSGTCRHASDYLAERLPPWEAPRLSAAGATDGQGHGPTGGDVVIADEIVSAWPCHRLQGAPTDPPYKTKPPVRRHPLSHTIVFFIDHAHAQPHQADIHVLLRTCIHPSHGVQLLLNERTAREWAKALKDGLVSGGASGVVR